jgi:hypothetical protein
MPGIGFEAEAIRRFERDTQRRGGRVSATAFYFSREYFERINSLMIFLLNVKIT